MNRLFWIVMALIGGGLVLLLVRSDAGTVFGIGNDQFARSLYLGVWGLVLAAAIFGSRRIRLGNAARSIAIWLLVLVALVAAYQYRYELQDFASRVTAGLVPGSPISVSTGDGGNEVVLQKLANGHFGARAEINGASVSMLVDTGASVTVLTPQDAARAGIDPSGLSYTVPVATANGATQAARVTADQVRIGSIVRRNVPILVAGDGRLPESLLGMDFIGTLKGFDVRGDRMILID